jgi:ABC-2 type transport system ATP-binding protein
MPPAIEISKLQKRYGDVTAVADISLSVEPGEIVGIVGVNGAGKTTTVECIAGLTRPDTGTISVLGMDPTADRDALRERVGVQLQESALPDRLTVTEALTLYGSFYEDPVEPAEQIERLGLTHRRNARYGKLSGGEKQRVSVGLALVGRPEVAILDELTTGLDPHARRELWSLIASLEGLTVVLVSHFMDEVERLCDRVAVMHAGRIVALDTPTNLKGEDTLEDTFVVLTSSPADRLQETGRAVSGIPGVGR